MSQENLSSSYQVKNNMKEIPNSMLPAFAPLSRSMVEHLIVLECRPYRRAVLSSWPEPQEVWSDLLERVERARKDVCEYMDVFVLADMKQAERTFPDDTWILEQLAAYTPENVRLTKKALEDWQSRNILRREQPRGRWRLDDVEALLIMRIVNDTHQRGWLPSEIPENEPRWWCYGKAGPDGPMIPIPLAGDDLLLLWTPGLGASWAGDWQRMHSVSVRWSQTFKSAEDVAVWHNDYAQEIQQAAQHAAETAEHELRLTLDGKLMARPSIQTVLHAAIQEAIERVQIAMLREAEQLILEEQAQLLVSRGKA